MEVKRLWPGQLSDDDFERAVKTMVDGFASMDFVQVFYFGRNMDLARVWWSKRLKIGLACGEVYQIDDFNGFAIWTPPGFGMDLPGGAEIQPTGGSFDDALREFLGEKAVEKRHNYLKTCTEHLKNAGLNYGDAWYLQAIVVSPERQGKGLGRALLQHKLDGIKAAFTAKHHNGGTHQGSHRVYFETVGSKNEAFYKSLGFKTSTVIPVADPDSLVNGSPRIYEELMMEWDCQSETQNSVKS